MSDVPEEKEELKAPEPAKTEEAPPAEEKTEAKADETKSSSEDPTVA